MALYWTIIAAWALAIAGALLLIRRVSERRQIVGRIYADTEPLTTPSPETYGWLHNRLILAGFRSPTALIIFIGATIALAVVGFTSAIVSRSSEMFTSGLRTLEAFPGGVGEIFLPVLYLGPWIFATILMCLPWLYVQHTRRMRVDSIEADLPVTLELLATLGEAGLSFDTALARLLDSQPFFYPLARELRTFQLDILSGRSRVECFRRLAARVDVPALSVFVSAIVQAEQVGAGVASVLRQQADDLRDRRRENAMALAMALPVKRLFPMIICFLPGIFVATLGPTFFQFFQYADTILRLQAFGGGP